MFVRWFPNRCTRDAFYTIASGVTIGPIHAPRSIADVIVGEVMGMTTCEVHLLVVA